MASTETLEERLFALTKEFEHWRDMALVRVSLPLLRELQETPSPAVTFTAEQEPDGTWGLTIERVYDEDPGQPSLDELAAVVAAASAYSRTSGLDVVPLDLASIIVSLEQSIARVKGVTL